MLNSSIFIALFCGILLVHQCSSKPVDSGREVEEMTTESLVKRGAITDALYDMGGKAVDGFDRVVYGLLDEAMQHVTDDKKGAFKDMIIRHRADLSENVRKNLIQKDKITLNDIKATVMREVNNRMELFNYVGGGLWSKLSSYSSDLFGQYKNHCGNNPSKIYCFNSQMNSKINNNEVEREDEPRR